jgi:homogentisate 1,2-dioxygenase
MSFCDLGPYVSAWAAADNSKTAPKKLKESMAMFVSGGIEH